MRMAVKMRAKTEEIRGGEDYFAQLRWRMRWMRERSEYSNQEVMVIAKELERYYDEVGLCLVERFAIACGVPMRTIERLAEKNRNIQYWVEMCKQKFIVNLILQTLRKKLNVELAKKILAKYRYIDEEEKERIQNWQIMYGYRNDNRVQSVSEVTADAGKDTGVD